MNLAHTQPGETIAAVETTLSQKVRRFFAFVFAVIRHTTTLLLSLISGGLVSSPAWIKPLLSPAHAVILDSWSQSIAKPDSYWLLAKACILVGIFFASFLAWNEERDEFEQLTLRVKSDKPDITAVCRGWTLRTTTKMLRFELEIVNSGAPTSFHGWQAGYRLRDGTRRFLADAMLSQEIISEGGPTNLVMDERILNCGGRRLGWVAFPVSEWSGDALSSDPLQLVQVSVQFYDHTNAFHNVSMPPDSMLEAMNLPRAKTAQIVAKSN
jgi:hypothetical protein